MAGVGIDLEGSADLIRTLSGAPDDWQRAWRHGLKHIAEPTRAAAEHHALTDITRMAHSPEWADMKVVIGKTAALIVPVQRGTRGRGNRKRPNLADLLQERALEPAEEENEKRFDRDAEVLLDKLVTKWNAPGADHG